MRKLAITAAVLSALVAPGAHADPASGQGTFQSGMPGGEKNPAESGTHIFSITLDPSDTQACDQARAFIQGIQDKISDPEVRKALLNQFCNPAFAKPGPRTLTLMIPGSSHHASPFEASVSGGYTKGDKSFLHLYGELSWQKIWENRHRLRIRSGVGYESESNWQKASVQSDYLYVISPNWGLFAAAIQARDIHRLLVFGSEEYVGPLYSIFPFANSHKLSVTLSVGVGDRYETYTDRYRRDDGIVSYRAGLVAQITEQIKVISAILFQHGLVTQDGDSSVKIYDLSNFRFAGYVGLQLGLDSELHVNLKFNYDYWNDPRPGRAKDEEDLLLGVGMNF